MSILPTRLLKDHPSKRLRSAHGAGLDDANVMKDETHRRLIWRRWLRPIVIERAMMAADATLIIFSGMLSASVYRWYAQAFQVNLSTYAAAAALIALNFFLLFLVQDGYQIRSIANLFRQVRMVFTTWTGLFAALLAAGFTMKISESFSRGAVITFYLVGLLSLLISRICSSLVTRRALSRGLFENSRVVVVAEQGLASSSWSLHELQQHGYRPSRVLEISATELSSPLLMSIIHTRFTDLVAYCRDQKTEQIFLLFNWNRQHVIESILDVLKVLPIPVHLVPDASVSKFLKYPAIRAGNTWTTELRRAPLTQTERNIKRAFDLCGAIAAIVLFTPIMLIAAVLIKIDSKGPILFRQRRNGFNGRGFRIFKFRTMRVTEDGPKILQATRHDVRITRIGRWLRKTSIDELPQLLNVLLGDMSLVGPRPHAAAHDTEYGLAIGSYAFRHHVKPGITGWAQVNGYRGETNVIGLMEKRVEFDLWYINNWSLWLDVSIVLKTALTSFRQSKAY